MANLYANKLWAGFREKIINLDGGVCVVCGRSKADGVVLQVHHKRYILGRRPWEYDPSDCETLCKGCHAREHGEIRPNTGWLYIGEDDLEDLVGTCDLCSSSIRYIHYVQHEHWEVMGVGTVCCDNLTGTEEATEARRQLGRLKRFMSSDKWICAPDFHEIKFRSFHVVVQILADECKLNINNTLGQRRFKCINEAKEYAFDFVDSGRAAKYFNKQ